MLKIFLMIFCILFSYAVYPAPLTDQTANLFSNGSMESGNFSPVNGSGVNSAATGWNQWMNSGSYLRTELITESEMESLSGKSLKDGSAAIRITTDGLNNGLYNFASYGHPKWAAAPTSDYYTYSAWVYVFTGRIYFDIDAYIGGNAVTSTKTNEWEFLSITQYGKPSEPLVYTDTWGADFVVDGVWLNQGTVSTYPSVNVPEVSSMFLFLAAITCLSFSRFAKIFRFKDR